MGGGGSSDINDASASKVFVRYKFKNDEKEYREWLTLTQFRNLQTFAQIEYYAIISDK